VVACCTRRVETTNMVAPPPSARGVDLLRVQSWLSTGALKHTLDPATPNSVDLARFIAKANGALPEELPDAGTGLHSG
jgi:hypothetical protein